MRTLLTLESAVHKFHDTPTTEIYDNNESAFIVYEEFSNYPFLHYVHASTKDEALCRVYNSLELEDIILEIEMINITPECVEWYHKINHD